MTPLPAWIDREAWDGFVEMRKRQERVSRGKIAWTGRAEKLVLAELYKLHDKGHDANKALDDSSMKGWTDVYPPKDKDIPNMKRETYQAEPARTPEQRAGDVAARDAAMAKLGIKLVKTA